jgi:hypothetical protein
MFFNYCKRISPFPLKVYSKAVSHYVCHRQIRHRFAMFIGNIAG